MFLLWTALAHAGLAVDGADGRSVVVVLDDGEREHAQLCGDDGQGPDAVAGDGVWACAPPPVQGAVRVGLVVDGVLVGTGAGDLSDDTLVRAGDPLQISADSPTPGAAGAPQSPWPLAVLRIDAGALDQAPMVALRGELGEVELACRDDGAFPDAAQNDDVATCAGPAPGRELSVSLRLPGGARDVPLTVDAHAAVIHARWDGAALTQQGADLLPAPSAAPDAQPPQPQGDGQPAQPAQPPQPAAPADGPSGGAVAWAVVSGLGLGLAGFWLGRRRREHLPEHLAWPQGDAAVLESRTDALDDAVRTLSRRGPVVVLGQGELPAGEPGPVLRCSSTDVLDVLESVELLRRQHGLRAIGVVVDRGVSLTAPGELGVSARERLQADAPAGVTVWFLEA
jgi:hypothetical protein